MSELYIFAVNRKLDGRHTFLSRSRGEVAELPDLEGWLGVPEGALARDEIELFPTEDLAGMALSDYVTTAFDLSAEPEGQLAARMNALEGHVMLIPSLALTEEVKTGPELTLIASPAMSAPDHSADALEPLPPSKPATPEPEPEPAEEAGMSPTQRRLWAVFTAFVLAVIIVFGREFF